MWCRTGIIGIILLLSACSPNVDFLMECHQLSMWVAELPADRRDYWQNRFNTQSTYKGVDIIGILKDARPEVASTEITRINNLAGETNYNHPLTTRICAPPRATPTKAGTVQSGTTVQSTAAVQSAAAARATATPTRPAVAVAGTGQVSAASNQQVAQQSGASPAAPLSAGQTISYTVRTGDTLTSIARQYGTTVDAIVRENNITDKDRIKVGQQLRIPGK
ncbi:MAG: LysM peptidoglycan-binding domain-containing protein [Chloroflexi bacterium]|nr:LysM peptidoglycan-binding domain-containing protein [Chloroflexota bacterium]